MSTEEKKALMAVLTKLSPADLNKALLIVAENNPNFQANGQEVDLDIDAQNYDKWGDVICHGKDKDIKEGHKSFPRGHTSWSFVGLGFLTLFLAGKVKVFDRRGHVAKLCILFVPLLMASLVAVSGVDDYWHHRQDVFAGGLLGLVVATMCYLQFFPAPYHSQGQRCSGPIRTRKSLDKTWKTAWNKWKEMRKKRCRTRKRAGRAQETTKTNGRNSKKNL